MILEGGFKMFKGKLTKNKAKICEAFPVVYNQGNIKEIKIISKISLTQKQLYAIYRTVESDLQNEKFDENGLTTLQILLIAGLVDEERIVLRKNSIQILVLIN